MKQLDPNSVWIFYFQAVLVNIFVFGLYPFIFSFALIAAWAEGDFIPVWVSTLNSLLWLLFLANFFLGYIWAQLSYKYYKYELTDNGFRKESGVIWKRYVTIPYERIQNVDILRGILARLLGLSDLHIQTAGMGVAMGEGRLPGLSVTEAEKLRDELIKRAKKGSQGL